MRCEIWSVVGDRCSKHTSFDSIPSDTQTPFTCQPEEGTHWTKSKIFFSLLYFFFFTIFQPNSVTATIGVTLRHYTLETSVASVKGTPSDGVDLLLWKCKFMTHFALGCRVAESSRVNPGRHIGMKECFWKRLLPSLSFRLYRHGAPTDFKVYCGLRNIRKCFTHSLQGNRTKHASSPHAPDTACCLPPNKTDSGQRLSALWNTLANQTLWLAMTPHLYAIPFVWSFFFLPMHTAVFFVCFFSK